MSPSRAPVLSWACTQTSDLGKGAVVKKKEGKEKREMNDNGATSHFSHHFSLHDFKLGLELY